MSTRRQASRMWLWLLCIASGFVLLSSTALAQEDEVQPTDPSEPGATLDEAQPTPPPAKTTGSEPVISDPWTPTERTVPEMTFAVGNWTTQITGYIRSTLTFIGLEGDDSPDFVGQNNGFVLFDARLAVIVRYLENFEVKLELDGAADLRENSNSVAGQQIVTLKDAYGAYKPGPWLGILVGQYKAPVNVETLLSTRDMSFIRRSVVDEGVRAGEGVESETTRGLGATREVGINFLSEVIEMGPVGVRYHLAITNGNSALATRNDNNLFAYYGRVEFHLLNALLGDYAAGSFLVLGGGANYNQRTVGETTNRLNTEDFSWHGDLQLNLYGVELLGSIVGRSREFTDTVQDSEDTMGMVGQLAYRYAFDAFAIMAGYRYARLDPIVDDAEDNLFAQDDVLQYHTVGVGYERLNLPMALKFNYTLTVEEGPNAIDNDIFEILFQFSW